MTRTTTRSTTRSTTRTALGRLVLTTLVASLATAPAAAQQQTPPSGPQWLNADPNKKTNQSNFRGIEEWLAPNEYRTASGSPGPKYWQQQVDYVIKASLDTLEHQVTGSETVTYHNNSPDALTYLWFQLDQNVERTDSRASLSSRPLPKSMANLSPQALRALGMAGQDNDLGMNIGKVQVLSSKGAQDAPFFVNGTSMRIELPAPLASGGVVRLTIDWRYKVPEIGRNTQRNARDKVKDGWLYEIAQWYPRAAVYDDVGGWTNDQFYSQGEFYQEFGNFDVSLTVPHDHIVRATGVLQNPAQALTTTQRARLAQAMKSDAPVFIVQPGEIGSPATRPAGTAPITWRFTAENVRDFAWA